MGEEIARVARLLEEQGIQPDGFSRTVYLDDPRAVDTPSYRYRVGFPVPRTSLPRKPLQREVIEPRLIARVRHEGDYDEAYQLKYYERIPAALKDFGYDLEGPITEIYCYPVVQQDPAKWVTELWYPVRKRTAEAASPDQTPERAAPPGTSGSGTR
jgi:effector-binding domain-containing protein